MLKMKLTSFIVIFVKVVMKLSVQILILSRNMEDLTIESIFLKRNDFDFGRENQWDLFESVRKPF